MVRLPKNNLCFSSVLLCIQLMTNMNTRAMQPRVSAEGYVVVAAFNLNGINFPVNPEQTSPTTLISIVPQSSGDAIPQRTGDLDLLKSIACRFRELASTIDMNAHSQNELSATMIDEWTERYRLISSDLQTVRNLAAYREKDKDKANVTTTTK